MNSKGNSVTSGPRTEYCSVYELRWRTNISGVASGCTSTTVPGRTHVAIKVLKTRLRAPACSATREGARWARRVPVKTAQLNPIHWRWRFCDSVVGAKMLWRRTQTRESHEARLHCHSPRTFFYTFTYTQDDGSFSYSNSDDCQRAMVPTAYSSTKSARLQDHIRVVL